MINKHMMNLLDLGDPIAIVFAYTPQADLYTFALTCKRALQVVKKYIFKNACPDDHKLGRMGCGRKGHILCICVDNSIVKDKLILAVVSIPKDDAAGTRGGLLIIQHFYKQFHKTFDKYPMMSFDRTISSGNMTIWNAIGFTNKRLMQFSAKMSLLFNNYVPEPIISFMCNWSLNAKKKSKFWLECFSGATKNALIQIPKRCKKGIALSPDHFARESWYICNNCGNPVSKHKMAQHESHSGIRDGCLE